MIRAFSLTCLALLMIAFTGAPALAKPTIAVLGLEVVDPSGTPSAQDTQVAKELSDGLRARAKAGTGQFQLAVGSDKELIDQKLLNNCDTEAPTCMATIGNQLGAEILMFGKIQKEGKTSYQVTLKVLDVGKKSVQKSSTDLIPVSESSGAALQGWAKKIYAKLTGEATGGSIVIKLSNADRGTILINGEEKGNITAGTGEVAGLPEGKYKVAVESDGFRRWDREITLGPGQTNTIPVELERGSSGGGATGGGTTGGGGEIIGGGPGSAGPHEGSSGTGMWKGVFVGSMVVAAAGGGWWAYNWSKLSKIEDDQCANGYRGCQPSSSASADFDLKKSNSDGNSKSTQTYIGGAVMGVGLAVAAFAFYKGFIAKPGSSSKETSSVQRGKRVRRERFSVTPIVAPNGGGATVRLDW